MRHFSVILAILCIPLGGYLFVVGFTEPIDPTVNNIIVVGGFLLMGGAVTYLLVRIIKSFVN